MSVKMRKAHKVHVGDSLAGLGDTYVYGVYVPSDLYYGNVEIEFHDRNGDECSLTVPPDFKILVQR